MKKKYEEEKNRFWKQQKNVNSYVKNKTESRSSIGPLKHYKTTITDDAEMATLLNNFFSSVFTREDTTHIPTMSTLQSNSVLNTKRFQGYRC